MHAAVGEAAHQVQLLVVPLRVPCGADELVVLEKGSILNGVRDAEDFLVDDAARPQIYVTDLRVAHLPLRQAHAQARGSEDAMGILVKQAVHEGRIRRVDGAYGRVLRDAPAVEDEEKVTF
jgi:hypothetical protein